MKAQIGDDLLYLGIEGYLEDGNIDSIETLFPDYPKRVFAH